MKAFAKKMTAGTIAATFLLGGAGLYQAFAAETSGTGTTDGTTQQQQVNNGGKHKAFGAEGEAMHGKRGGGAFQGGGIIENAASVIGIDAKALKEELKQNKTLAQIAQEKAGLSEEAFLQKLTEAETKKLDEAVASGKLTQEQADQIKSKLADRLKKQVTAAGAGQGHMKGKGHMEGKGGKGPGFMAGPEVLTQLLGMTQEELKTAMQSGKSLAEIAQEKGISREQLIQKLKDNMDQKLNEFVDRKHTGKKTQAPAAQDPAAATTAPAQS